VSRGVYALTELGINELEKYEKIFEELDLNTKEL
jgi:predicted transcriptional regulator